MDDQSKQQRAPSFRVWLCGAFRVERHVGASYEGVRTSEWGGSSYPRLLLKALLCCPGRQARREALLDMLWPEIDPEQAVQNLNTATTKLRKVLQPVKGHESLLLTEDDSKHFLLEGQHLLWVDVDEARALLNEAERLGRTSSEALPLLEQATGYLGRGTLLEEEGGAWVIGRRATVDRMRYRARLWLSEACIQHRRMGQAEAVLNMLLEEDPTDEDVLCRLMNLLHEQGMTHQALRVYKQACEILAQEDIELAEKTRQLALRIEQERQYPLQERTNSMQMKPSLIDVPLYTPPLLTTIETSSPTILTLPSTAIPLVKPIKTVPLDCATHFGTRLAQMVTLIHQWYGMAAFCNELQDRLTREIKQLDQMKMQFPLEEYMHSRCNVLATLAALPVSLIASARQKHKTILALEEFLPTCAAGITACWNLSGGSRSQLDVIVPLLDSYLPILLNICQYTSTYREVAADLVAQVYFLKAILSWHMEGLELAETYCIQGMRFSDIAKNVNLQLTALNQHALIAYYSRDFQKALAKSEEADERLRQASHDHVFPIIEGRVCMYLAAIQAQQQSKGAEFTLARAQAAFAEQAARTEAVPVYADCGDAPLLLWDGLTHYYLGPRSKEHADRALASLSTFGPLVPSATIPERFRLECLNNRILAAIQLGELEEAIACFKTGQHGAQALESKQRSTEIDYAYQLMCNRWPREERVKKLREQMIER
jgi:DNA-binding SARP family transcriptional activator